MALLVLLAGILLYPQERCSGLCVINLHTGLEIFPVSIYPGITNKPEGLRAVIRYKDGFLAVGSDGRIDLISVSGEIIKSEKFPGENFNSVISDNEMVIAAGDNGTILISPDGRTFRKADSHTDKNINSLTLFNTIIVAGTDDGDIIIGDENGFFKKTHPDVKGNIVSVSARNSDCYGVTDEGEIIHTTDGLNWDIFDFNKVYAGFYKPCSFTRVLATENRIAVAGIRDDGSPVLMFSNQGKVWTERTLNYTDEKGMPGFLEDLPQDIFYDEPVGDFFLACNNGKLMKLMSCTLCNELAVISLEDLAGISCNENTMMIVGEKFLIITVKLR